MYYTTDGKQHYDFGYSREEGRYRKVIPSVWNFQRSKKSNVSTDRTDLRGKVCPGCGLTRSMTNKCDCNED
jgi:hypothetical protein